MDQTIKTTFSSEKIKASKNIAQSNAVDANQKLQNQGIKSQTEQKKQRIAQVSNLQPQEWMRVQLQSSQILQFVFTVLYTGRLAQARTREMI